MAVLSVWLVAASLLLSTHAILVLRTIGFVPSGAEPELLPEVWRALGAALALHLTLVWPPRRSRQTRAVRTPGRARVFLGRSLLALATSGTGFCLARGRYWDWQFAPSPSGQLRMSFAPVDAFDRLVPWALLAAVACLLVWALLSRAEHSPLTLRMQLARARYGPRGERTPPPHVPGAPVNGRRAACVAAGVLVATILAAGPPLGPLPRETRVRVLDPHGLPPSRLTLLVVESTMRETALEHELDRDPVASTRGLRATSHAYRQFVGEAGEVSFVHSARPVYVHAAAAGHHVWRYFQDGLPRSLELRLE